MSTGQIFFAVIAINVISLVANLILATVVIPRYRKQTAQLRDLLQFPETNAMYQ